MAGREVDLDRTLCTSETARLKAEATLSKAEVPEERLYLLSGGSPAAFSRLPISDLEALHHGHKSEI